MFSLNRGLSVWIDTVVLIEMGFGISRLKTAQSREA